MILQLQNITKSFGVDVILENISLQVDNGEKVGLIGANVPRYEQKTLSIT